MSKARDIASAAPAPSTVSATEIGYLDGVTSAIQTQLDAKTAKSTLTTTGDIYYASAANTPARLGIGTAAQLLAVNSGATAPEWVAAPAAGGMTLISTTALSGTSTTVDSIPGTYKGLVAIIDAVTFNTSAEFTVGLTSATNIYNSIIGNAALSSQTAQSKVRSYASTVWPTGVVFQLYNYTSTAGSHTGQLYYGDLYNGSVSSTFFTTFSSTAVTSLIFSSQAGTSTFSSGTVKLYGVN